MINNNDIEIEHGGMVKTIGEMVSDLTTGHASYWHWHTLFSKVIRLYNSAKNEESDEGTLYRKALKDYVLGFGI